MIRTYFWLHLVLFVNMALSKNLKSIIFSLLVLIVGIVFYLTCDNKFDAIIITSILVILSLCNLFFFLKRDDNFGKNIILAVGFGVTIISWFISGYITNQQSILQKKRDLKVKFLIDAYFKLANYDGRDKETIADGYIYDKFAENSLNEIQLIGDLDVVTLGQTFALSGGKDGYRDLLIQLRKDLRKELSVSPLSDDIIPYSFRFIEQFPVKDTITSSEQINLIIRLNEANQDLIK